MSSISRAASRLGRALDPQLANALPAEALDEIVYRLGRLQERIAEFRGAHDKRSAPRVHS